MKHLNDYTDDATTELFNKTGAFFAFGNQQFNEQKQEGVEYVAASGGMICPKDKVKELLDGLDAIAEAGIKKDLEENGRQGVIHRELGNHEYSYTGDISDTVRALGGYGITAEEITAETGEYMRQFREWEEKQEAIA